MLFNSYDFILIFLPAVLAGAYVLSKFGARVVGVWVLLNSLIFYAYWDVRFLPLLVGSIAANFALARVIDCTKSKAALVLAISGNLALLGYFKYLGFFSDIASIGFHFGLAANAIVLPLAISFFTFQQIGYQIDSWRGGAVRHSFLDYFLYISFFPQLIAGPIVRQGEFLPQIGRLYRGPRARDLVVGLTLFSIGLFKKVVLADTFAGWSTPVFDATAGGAPVDLATAWLGAFCYTFQIYFDFSGYADMAIGLGRMFGVRLPLNFNAPYRARSVTDFWRRWHITLGRFLRDYLYIPLGGNRVSPSRQAGNLMVVMLLAGLWHGAAWTFVIWGGLHGLVMAGHRVWHRLFGPPTRRSGIREAAAWAATFLFLVVTWVFFRADGLDSALTMLQVMAGFGPHGLGMPPEAGGVAFAWWWVAAGLAWVLLLPTSHELMRRYMRSSQYLPYLEHAKSLVRPTWRPNLGWTVASGVIFAAAFLGLSRVSEFIYYQF